MAVLNIRRSWLREMDGILSNSILIDMLAPEPSMTRTVRRGGREILQGEEKEREGRVGEGGRLIPFHIDRHLFCMTFLSYFYMEK